MTDRRGNPLDDRCCHGMGSGACTQQTGSPQKMGEPQQKPNKMPAKLQVLACTLALLQIFTGRGEVTENRTPRLPRLVYGTDSQHAILCYQNVIPLSR